MKRLLREAKRIADEAGFGYAGVRGSGHHAFVSGPTTIVMANSPKNEGDALKNFRKDIYRFSGAN